MFRLRRLLSLMAIPLVAVAFLAAPSLARANFQLVIRATEFDSGGVALNTATFSSTPATSPFGGTAAFVVGNFSLTSLMNITNTGGFSTSVSNTININYSGATGPNSETLLLEVLVSNLSSPPTSGALAQVTANA